MPGIQKNKKENTKAIGKTIDKHREKWWAAVPLSTSELLTDNTKRRRHSHKGCNAQIPWRSRSRIVTLVLVIRNRYHATVLFDRIATCEWTVSFLNGNLGDTGAMCRLTQHRSDLHHEVHMEDVVLGSNRLIYLNQWALTGGRWIDTDVVDAIEEHRIEATCVDIS